jgi:CheY-like chemotaxis protein
MRPQKKGSLVVVNGRLVRAGEGGQKDPPGSDLFTVRSDVKTTEAPKRILVVEDNLDSVHSLAFLLQQMGHTVEYAINGYAGLEAARRFQPEFVLLDLGLPGLDGLEVCRRIKRDEQLRSMRVIALTAFSQNDLRERAAQAGCELYLVKPVEATALEKLFG